MGDTLQPGDYFHLPSDPEDEPYLIGSTCISCGRSFFPRRSVCPDCLKQGTMEEKALSRLGGLFTYYVSMVAPLGFQAPFAAGYIDLPEGVRVYAPLTGFDLLRTSLRLGTKMELIVDKIYEDEHGNDVIGYKFKPCESS